MISVVIPLAGPDFYSATNGIRPFSVLRESTLIESVLEMRPWMRNFDASTGSELVFVLREEGAHTAECRGRLFAIWPDAKFATVSVLTRGALFSAIVGASICKRPENHLVVDLADILFESDINVSRLFADEPELQAVVPVFTADSDKFSYLEIDGDRVLRAREKEVISTHASAGVYIFRNSGALLRSAAWSLKYPEIGAVRGSYFVCPAVNGLIGEGARVKAVQVGAAEPISLKFH